MNCKSGKVYIFIIYEKLKLSKINAFCNIVTRILWTVMNK